MLFDFLLFENVDQRNFIKFCVKNETKCARAFEILTKANDESSMRRTQVQLWYNRLKEGREDINDDVHSSSPNASTTDENTEAKN